MILELVTMRNIHNLLQHCFLKSFFHSSYNHFSFLSLTYPHLPLNYLVPSFYKYFPFLTFSFPPQFLFRSFLWVFTSFDFNYSFLPYICTSKNVVPYQCHSFLSVHSLLRTEFTLPYFLQTLSEHWALSVAKALCVHPINGGKKSRAQKIFAIISHNLYTHCRTVAILFKIGHMHQTKRPKFKFI